MPIEKKLDMLILGPGEKTMESIKNEKKQTRSRSHRRRDKSQTKDRKDDQQPQICSVESGEERRKRSRSRGRRTVTARDKGEES